MKSAKYILFLLGCLGLLHLSAQEAQLVIPMGHAQQINCVVTSHDFRMIASSDDSNIIHLWNTETTKEIMQLRDHPAGIVNVDFHPLKGQMASSDQLGNIYIWDTKTGAVLHKIKIEDKNPLVKFNPTGKILYIGGEKLSQYNSASGQLIKEIEPAEKITAITYSTYHRGILVGTTEGSTILYDNQMVESKRHQHYNSPISTIAGYNETKKGVVVGYEDGHVTTLDLQENRIIHNAKVLKKACHNILINPQNGNIIVMGRDSEIDVKFLTPQLKDNKSMKFKWSSKPTDDHGLIGIDWADDKNDKVYIADHGGTIRIWSTKESKFSKEVFKGTARPIFDIDVNDDGETLVIGSRHGQMKVIDLTGARQLILLRGVGWDKLIQLAYHEERPLVIGAGKDKELKIYDMTSGEMLERLKRMDHLDFNIEWTTNNNFLRKIESDVFKAYDFKRKSERSMKVLGAIDMKISADGSSIVFRTSNEIRYYAASTLEFEKAVPTPAISDFSFSGEKLLTLGNGVVAIYNEGIKEKDVKISQKADRIKGLENGDFVLFSSEESHSTNFNAYHIDQSGKLVSELKGHHDYISTIVEVQERILTASHDGSIKIWKASPDIYEEIGSIIPLRLEDYVVITPDDLFDATPFAMSQMHFTMRGEIIALEQLKDTYYEPNLLPKLLGFGDTDLRKPADINELGLAPTIEITQHPNKGAGILKFKTVNKGGGIGRVQLIINGKEVSSNLRKTKTPDAEFMELEYDINGHPFLYDYKPNKIGIKGYNEKGTLGSEFKNIYILPTEKKSTAKPKIFALIIGTSDYVEDEMDLKFAAKDAQDFAAALRISSSNLIGGDNLKMSVLTTNKEKDQWPTKANIQKTFKEFSDQASARDFLIVYMAGHGVNSGGEDGDFYYLTGVTQKMARCSMKKPV